MLDGLIILVSYFRMIRLQDPILKEESILDVFVLRVIFIVVLICQILSRLLLHFLLDLFLHLLVLEVKLLHLVVLFIVLNALLLFYFFQLHSDVWLRGVRGGGSEVFDDL